MTRIDFYVVEEDDPTPPGVVACRVIEKAWRTGRHVHVRTESSRDARDLDRLLWTFRQDSFVPHALTENLTAYDPVVIGSADEPEVPSDGAVDVLVNLGRDVPDWAPNCERIVEVVAGDPEIRVAARLRYQQYRERKFEMHTHRLPNAHSRSESSGAA